MKRQPEPAEAAALRLAIAATIAAILKTTDEAEYRRLIARRNALGRQLAQLLKNRTFVL